MTHASVFSGIGGPEVAATMLGWENLFHCEINPFGRKVLDYWYPNSKSYEDITKTDFTEWRGRVDVLTGGFPCQPFSYAGRRRGAEDDRYLWPSMYRAIDEIQPTWVVAENVAGILTMVEQGEVSKMAGTANLFDTPDDVRGRYELRETFTLQRICTDLESHGYTVQPVLIPACAVGAPHRRDRVFIVARRKEESASANSVGSGKRTSRPSGEPESSRGDTHQQPSERGAETEWNNRFYAILRNATDTESEPSERPQPRQSKDGREKQEQSGGRGGEDGGRGISTDTCHAGLQEARPEQPTAGHRGFGVRAGEWVEKFGRGEEIGSRWQNFPSASPVHRGNDGLPFDVDNLTLSFGKWRTEALKAYGNAIVPQVMYEIFRAIEIVEQN